MVFFFSAVFYSGFYYICTPQNRSRIKIPSEVKITTKIHCGVEQLVARRAHNPKVVGSNPSPATTTTALKNRAVVIFAEKLFIPGL